MKKLYTFAFYSLVAPLVTLSAGSVIAQQDNRPQDTQSQSAQQEDTRQQSTQSGQSSSQRSSQSGQSGQAGQSSTQQRDTQQGAASQQSQSRQSSGAASAQRTQGSDSTYLSAAPANGVHAGNLIGSDVKSMNNENVGSISDLVIDSDGQVAAIVVGVGGFLGVGEKDVAISWDSVTRTENPQDEGVMVDVSRESLNTAPAFQSSRQ